MTYRVSRMSVSDRKRRETDLQVSAHGFPFLLIAEATGQGRTPPGPHTSRTLSSLPDLTDTWLGSRLWSPYENRSCEQSSLLDAIPFCRQLGKHPMGLSEHLGVFPVAEQPFSPLPSSANANLFPQRRSQPSQDRRRFLREARASPPPIFGLITNSSTVTPERST